MGGAISKKETHFGISCSFLSYGTPINKQENVGKPKYLYFKTLSHMLAKYVTHITVT